LPEHIAREVFDFTQFVTRLAYRQGMTGTIAKRILGPVLWYFLDPGA
jgi:hypothetical protein